MMHSLSTKHYGKIRLLRNYCSNQHSKNTQGIDAKKHEDFANWYHQVVTKTELIEFYDISGCYIIRPWAYRIWEQIQSFLDQEFKKTGVENASFPLLVTEAALSKEQNHIEGFSAEVAWITKTGDKELATPIAIRPTSETIMYPAYARWIQSYRDLPLKLNQWNNVVRWEFHKPVPFLRSREFLWQEGHSAFATKEEAQEEVIEKLETYKRAYEELLAVPVISGTKSNNEKFAGADYTTTLELYLDGPKRALQGATSHHLGQRFSKLFDIKFLSKKHNLSEFAWQNSWGFTTRSIGAMIMVHGDDKGLVLPPKVSPIQVVIIPIQTSKGGNNEQILAYVDELKNKLQKSGLRVHIDDRTTLQPGYKFSHWELKGVPLRLDVGQRDLGGEFLKGKRRDTGEAIQIDVKEVESNVHSLLANIQSDLLNKAREKYENSIQVAPNWKDFLDVLNEGKIALVEWCQNDECEKSVKKRTQHAEDLEKRSAKSLCIPFRYAEKPLETHQCFACQEKSQVWTLFGRSY